MTEAAGYRLLLFDLDGTLLDSKRGIHPENLAVLKAYMAAGIGVGFATGRSPRCADSFAQLLKPSAPLIHFNGAVVRDWTKGEVLHHQRLSLPDALRALALGASLGAHANVYVADDILIARRSALSQESEVKDGVPHTVVADLTGFLSTAPAAPTKLLFITEPERIPALLSGLEEQGRGAFSVVNSEPTYVEVLPLGTSKGAAAAVLAAKLGLNASQVIAFGDNLNDVELLQSAGLGVAMDNSHPTLKARAHRVIGHHDTPAIATFLSQTLELIGGTLRPANAMIGGREHDS
jgi:Cof subfamily protein (haloacid dehalogenase superfamily)